MKNEINTNRKKRIAFYIGSLCKGGAERVICNLAEYFLTQDYEVYMVTKLKDEIEYEISPGIIRVIADITKDEETGSRLGNLKARIDKLSKVWSDIKPDIIVSFIKKNNLMALASAKRLHIPVIVSVRSAPARELEGRGVKELTFLLFRTAAGIVLQTNEAKEYFPGYLQRKITILPNSLNPVFVGAIDKAEVQNVRKKQIIAVGRIDDNKNQRLLVEAFSQIVEKYPEWSVHLYGDGQGRKRLEQYVSENGLDNHVIFHGVVSNVVDRMRDAAIFVLPSKVEGMPNALIEAMAMKCACISTDCPCGGPRDLIEDGENGILVAVDDSRELAKALERLITDEELRNRLGENGGRIIDSIHPDIVNAKWKDYIESKIK